MSMRDALREVKHKAWVAQLSTRESGSKLTARGRDVAYRSVYSGRSFDFSSRNYRRSFLHWDAPPTTEETVPDLPRRVFCFWTGDNPLTPARRQSLDVMRERMGVDVLLVTPETLGDFVTREAPLHRAYEHLSLNHRSDYLRAYFMHHHGGGYSDIKQPTSDWSAHFDRMRELPRTWLLGYPEFSSLWVATYPGRLGRDLRRWHATLPGGGAYISRPRTPLTTEWLAEIDRRLDYYADLLSAHPGGTWGRDPKYPVSWNRLSAQVLQPLALKFHDRIAVDAALRPIVTGHR